MNHLLLKIKPFLLPFLCLFFLNGCGSESVANATDNLPLRDNTAVVLPVDAPGTSIVENEVVSFDISNLSDAYIMLTYRGNNEKVKFQISGPNDITYTYLVTDCTEPTAFPLTGENGSYTFTLYESVDAENNKYYISFTHTEDVTISDEFLPFLTPNVYVDFNADSSCVSKGVSLAEDCYHDLDVVEKIYEYVINNITYDTVKAENVVYGYTPNPDEVLSTGTGICFDYASLMTSMLRSQGIPTKLEVGYAGEAYHAWISCYLDEIGWVANIIEFDGEHWSLMDPTLASNNDRDDVEQYIGDGSKYVVKYTY